MMQTSHISGASEAVTLDVATVEAKTGCRLRRVTERGRMRVRLREQNAFPQTVQISLEQF